MTYAEIHNRYFADKRAATISLDEECTCGHTRGQHDPRCTGTGADLDVEYGIPADEACACIAFAFPVR